MKVFEQIVGLTAILLLLMIGIGFVMSWLQWMTDRWRDREQAIARQDVGNQILSASWWFGEYPDARLALKLLGEHLMRQSGFRPDPLRDDFEKLRASEGGQIDG